MAFSALEALQAFGAGRQMAIQDRERGRADQLRSDLTRAYDVNTGRLDPRIARTAYIGAGDVEGVMRFDRDASQRQSQELEQHRERIVIGGRLLADVNDELGYQQALALARQEGIDLGDVPPNFDPNYVDGIRRLASAYAPPSQQQSTEFQRNLVFLEREHPEAAADYLARETEQTPLTVRNDDGTITIIPRVARSQTRGAMRPARRTPAQLRADADDAIRRGAPREQVEAEYQRMIGGGAGRPQAPGTFRGRPVADGGSAVRSVFPQARITETRRSRSSRLGRANPDSWHVRSGGAVDVAPIPGMTFEQYVRGLEGAGYRIIEQRDEVNNPSAHATGPHWHVVIGEGP